MGETFFERIKWAIIFWLARRLPDCKTITPLLGESLDRKTTLFEKAKMQLHLFACEYCARYLKQIAFLKKAAHSHGERVPESDEFAHITLSNESKARIKSLLRAKAGLAL